MIGAPGFIGPRLIRRLIARGQSVVGMDLNPGASPFGDVPIGAPVVRGGVTQFEDVMRIVLDVKPERFINLAYGLGAGEGNPHSGSSIPGCTRESWRSSTTSGGRKGSRWSRDDRRPTREEET